MDRPSRTYRGDPYHCGERRFVSCCVWMNPQWAEALALWDGLKNPLPASRTFLVDLDLSIERYRLPLTFVALVVMFIVWRLQRREWERACEALHQTTDLKHQLERERNDAQEELLRRLYEDRELNKQKFQFQAQLAEYEKYSTLAQLALGAAHGINNPLLGILSHLELELKSADDPEQRWEVRSEER